MSAFVLPLVERAAANFLRAQTFVMTDEDRINFDSTRIYEGLFREWTVGEEGQVLVPCVTCSCVNAISEALYAGNWQAELLVAVRSKVFDTSDTKHLVMVEEVMAYLFSSTIADDLTNALAGFTAELVVPRQQSRTVENNCWVSVARFQVNCCGSTIS
jgi:hypothetical protein